MANRLYRKLVPHGSRRDRFAWISMVTIKKLREGPGPWLRAVKKGIYQMLPTGLQHRILKWTGQDQFFKRDAARHATADGGVEQPGIVSVVLPVFNQADMLAAAVDSVLAQSYAQFELIIVDDGSQDDVQAALQGVLQDPRVRIVTQPNQGLPKALSTGFELAVGEFFTWTSADNLMHAEQLTRLVAFLRDRPQTSMVYCDYELIDEQGAPLIGGEFRVMDRTDKDNLSAVRVNRSTHDLNRYEDNFIGGCFMYRGQIGRLLGDYNPELGLEDYDYWMRINRMFQIEHLGSGELLYRYRVHENTLSAKARELKILERAKVLMVYERERAAWIDAPFVFDVDEQSGAWLAPLLRDGDSIRDETAVDANQKTLIVRTPQTLANYSPATPPHQHSLATWFANPEQVYGATQQLLQLPVAAFAANNDTATRLAVFTRTVFQGEPNQGSLQLARLHASNGTFFRKTRDRDKLRRVVPTPLDYEPPFRVLLQLDTFGKGGLEQVVLDLATCLAHEGCRVGLLAIDGSSNQTDLPAGVTCVGVTDRSDASYQQMLREGRWQAVSAHASTHGAAVARAHGVPFVQVVHNSYVWFDRHDIDAYRTADPHTAAYACVSAQALGYADLRMQLDVEKMLVIENGIEEHPVVVDDARALLRRELGIDEHDFVFLQVASLQPAKAHRIAVGALAQLRQGHANARLVCLGSEMNPIHAADVRGDIQALDLEDAVLLAGHRNDAAECYAMADAFLLPSYWEGCSLAVWEAIRAGLPLVLSKVGAAEEQLRHGHGQLVDVPFASMFALDASNLDEITRGVQQPFVAATADAMNKAMDLSVRANATLPTIANRSTMSRRHSLLLRWLAQGGPVAGIRESIARAAHQAIPTGSDS